VYNLNGRKVTTLMNKFNSTGFHSAQFDGSNLPSGLCFYISKADNFVAGKRMFLIK